MAITELSDVDVQAISLCKKGANRQRIFLYKADDESPDTVELAYAPIIKNGPGSDWTVMYAVVAEPGALELPGRTGTLEDRWAGEDEILKAAHRFMRNGALVNLDHAGKDSHGQIVENAIAQDDFTVNEVTIKKGSWYVAIEPNDEARAAIDKGDIEGISIEGWGTRTEVEKRTSVRKNEVVCPECGFSTFRSSGLDLGDPEQPRFCAGCGRRMPQADPLWTWFEKQWVEKVPGPPGTDIARNQGKQAGPLRHLIAHYMKMPHPFTSCVRDNRKRFGDRAENICAALKDIALQTTHWRKGSQKLAKDDGEPDADVIEARIGVCENLWATHRMTDEDAILALQAIAWHEGREEGRLKSALKKIGIAVGVPEPDLAELDQPDEKPPDEEDQVGLTKEESERLDSLEKSVSDLGTSIDSKLDSLTEAIQKAKPEEPPKPEELRDELKKVDGKLDELSGKIEKLAEGSSELEDDEGTNGTKKTAVKKSALSGILFDS